MKIRILKTIAVAALSSAVLAAAGNDLFDAIRSGNAARVKTLVQSGADSNTRDDIGAAPLMYAAALPSQDCLRALLDKGVDVNAATPSGSTALMWATANTEAVRLLLDRGAVIDAKTKDGTTALVTAARRGNVDAVKLLLARGANPKAAAKDGQELLLIANFPAGPGQGAGRNPELRRVLAEAGLELKSKDQLGPLASIQLGLGDTALLNKMLDWGIDPNEKLPVPAQVYPTVILGVYTGDLDYVRVLMERGGDPNSKSSRGLTLLMEAANASRPNPAMARLLIDKGADVNARDDLGRSPLDWALMQGDTEVVRLLREKGAKAGTWAPSAPAWIAKPRTARAAIQAAIPRLQPIGPTFNKHSGCISCHNQSLPEVAVKLASARRIPVDAGLAAHPAKATVNTWKSARENLMLARESAIGGFVENVTYGLWALAEDGVPANPTTDAVVSRLSAMQAPDGSWPEIDPRPPLGGITPIVFTALAIRGLDAYSPPALREDAKNRIARAREYLSKAAPAETQDESFKLLGLVWSGAPATEISRERDRLRGLQRDDGGWAQWPTLASDSYATGQALYALRVGGLSPRNGVYRKGVAYLLRSQLDDGTWFVRSRAFPLQAYFDAGFPHGTDQFISAAATSWAAIALAGVL